ncbi:glycosyltransferase family 39 protein [bacterium]|nr:glycosyltransferase family 39 protein [bacterium]
MRDLAAALLGYAVILALGDSVARLLLPREGGEREDACGRLALAFSLGAGAVSLLLFWASLLVPGRVGAAFVLAPSLALVAAQRSPREWLPWARALPARAKAFARSLDRWSALAALVLGAEIAASVAASLSSDLSVDGVAIYALKAKLAFVSGGMPLSHFQDLSRQWSHLDYPLLLPLDEAFFFFLRGEASLVLAKALAPGFFAALLLLFYSTVSRARSRPVAILFAGLLGSLPGLVERAPQAEADLALALAWFGSVAHMHRFFREGNRRDLVIASLLAAVCAWTKREGFVFLGVQAVALLLVPLLSRKPHGETRAAEPWWRAWLPLSASALVVVGPWIVLLRALDVPGNDFHPVMLETTRALIHRLPEASEITLRQLFWRDPPPSPHTCLDHWGLLWHLFVIAGALVFATRKEIAPRLYVFASAAVPLALFSFAYIYSVWGPNQLGWVAHMKFSEFRLILQEAPGAFFLVALVLGDAPRMPGEVAG